MRRLFAVGLAAALALTGCSSTGDDGDTGSADTPAATSETDRSYDVSTVERVDEIAAMVPDTLVSDGKLIVAAAIDYAPAEFRADDLQTAIGYDMDLARAIGNVLGLETEINAAEFANLLGGMGSQTDIGISSFTVTPERTASYNMIAYIEVGTSYGVQTGNPNDFDPDNPCGATIGVQTGTSQELELRDIAAQCEADGKDSIEILSYGVQSDVTTNVAGGKADAFMADSTVADYAVALTNGQLEVVGGIYDSYPQGIVVPQDNQELTDAVQAAMQYLMDEGIWTDILDSWGISAEAALDEAALNPEV